jgi:hypothetical protein
MAVASAIAALSGAARADFAPGDARIDYDVHFSGATASAQFVRNSLIDNVCDPAGVDAITVFQKDTDDFQIICQLKAAVSPTPDVVRFIKQGGGSGDGTTPISRPTVSPLQYPKGAFNVGNCAAPVAASTGGGVAYRFYNNCVIPNVVVNGGDIGTSDVEPKLFFDVNTPSTGIAFTPADSASIDTKALAGLGYGIVVTRSLRNAMQALQFPTDSACHPANAEHTELLPTTADIDGDGVAESLDVGRIAAGAQNPTADVSPSLGVATVADSEECMPNITTAEVAGIFTGRITNWSQVHRQGKDLIQAATDANALIPGTANDIKIPAFSAVQALNYQRVHICRRDPGSGTGAQFHANFLHRPCANVNGQIVAEASLAAANGTCAFTNPSVLCSNRGSSDLGRCLHALENAALSGNSPELFNNGDANPTNNTRFAWAIGYQSVENNQTLRAPPAPGISGHGDYRFVKVDGLAPTLQNVYLADYTDHYEQTCQIRKNNTAIDPNVPGTTLRSIFNAVCRSGNFDVFLDNQNFLHPWGQAGWLVVPDGPGGTVSDAPTDIANLMNPNAPVPVSSWTRRGESCSVPTVFDPVQSTIEENLPKGQERIYP